MEPITIYLGGALVAITSGVVGKYIGENGKVEEDHCGERRESCQALLLEKIDTIDKGLTALTKAVNAKLLGL